MLRETPRSQRVLALFFGLSLAIHALVILQGINGVPQLSTLDGWWLEGHVDGITGWSIGDRSRESGDDAAEAGELYSKLEHGIAPVFYEDRAACGRLMQHAIAINGSFFTAHRMVQQYAVNAYFAEDEAAPVRSSAGADGITTAVQGHAP